VAASRSVHEGADEGDGRQHRKHDRQAPPHIDDPNGLT
jgi:hypothetical protein